VLLEIACAGIHATKALNGDFRVAAPLGWVDYQGNSEFIVGITGSDRRRSRFCLYAGAGIAAGSDPDKELCSTEAQALLVPQNLLP